MDRIKRIIINYKLYVISVIIIVLLLIFLIIGKYRLSPLEELAITKYSNEMMPYMDILEKDETDYYVCYALVYYDNVYNQQELSIKEIVDFINDHFSKKVTKKQIQSLGITPYMIDKHITYNIQNDKYVITTNGLSYSDIAKTKIVKYSMDKIKKRSKDTYQVSYQQYVIKNPYEILNYYQDKKDNLAVKNINNYLIGNGNRKSIEEFLDSKNIGKFGKYVGTVKIKYNISDNSILIFSKESSK